MQRIWLDFGKPQSKTTSTQPIRVFPPLLWIWSWVFPPKTAQNPSKTPAKAGIQGFWGSADSLNVVKTTVTGNRQRPGGTIGDA
jgi:hypothetical protein